ncbi:hypothetical protein DOL92_04660 [Acinetobacter nosocomialis]|uniref:phage tail fiber protein n=1 Tax=Acinetobacter nosocomialis TaxID=106654 RepID=UPI000DA82B1E|nr:hypothetical protein [Acinetobacter nosocomialis]PZM04676.1 hypothetical protein DOL92_04660 [Acinetobacter nosocomialis]
MTIQTVNLGTAPTGAGGDTFRSTGAKMNENFTNNMHAASRLVGTAAGNLTEIGLDGWTSGLTTPAYNGGGGIQNLRSGISSWINSRSVLVIKGDQPWRGIHIGCANNVGNPRDLYIICGNDTDKDWGASYLIYNSANTTVDSNGFIKAASPIVKLFADKIELNDEAAEQTITFEKIDVGHYLIKGSSGFAKEGWWIEIPTDTHGNKICAVEYQTLGNGDLEIKTFKKKLNEDGDIVANLDAPIDIPNNANGEPRWIDIRLNSIKKTIVRKIPRTEKQPRMVQQVKYAPQLTYITKYEDLFDDAGNPVVVGGKNYQKPVTHIQTDQNGTPILSNQPVINENGEPVFEWVQAVDSEGNPVFDDVPVLDKDGNPIYDEVTYDPE